MILLFLLLGVGVGGFPAQDSSPSRKVLGSSVVTSVSVIMDAKDTHFADALGKPVPKPQSASQVASPIDLLNPDRYEFYTFDDSGDLVKRLMTLEEIQSIIASSGDGEAETYKPEKKVNDVVNNVQNVLKEEMLSHKNTSAGILDTPDVSSSWSVILPAIFGNTGQQPSLTADNIFGNDKPVNSLIADTIMVEDNQKVPLVQKPMPFTKKPVKTEGSTTKKPIGFKPVVVVNNQESLKDSPVKVKPSGIKKPIQNEDRTTRKPIQNEEKPTRKPIQNEDKTTKKSIQNFDDLTRKPIKIEDRTTRRPIQNEDELTRKPIQDEDEPVRKPIQNVFTKKPIQFDDNDDEYPNQHKLTTMKLRRTTVKPITTTTKLRKTTVKPTTTASVISGEPTTTTKRVYYEFEELVPLETTTSKQRPVQSSQFNLESSTTQNQMIDDDEIPSSFSRSTLKPTEKPTPAPFDSNLNQKTTSYGDLDDDEIPSRKTTTNYPTTVYVIDHKTKTKIPIATKEQLVGILSSLLPQETATELLKSSPSNNFLQSVTKDESEYPKTTEMNKNAQFEDSEIKNSALYEDDEIPKPKPEPVEITTATTTTTAALLHKPSQESLPEIVLVSYKPNPTSSSLLNKPDDGGDDDEFIEISQTTSLNKPEIINSMYTLVDKPEAAGVESQPEIIKISKPISDSFNKPAIIEASSSIKPEVVSQPKPELQDKNKLNFYGSAGISQQDELSGYTENEEPTSYVKLEIIQSTEDKNKNKPQITAADVYEIEPEIVVEPTLKPEFTEKVKPLTVQSKPEIIVSTLSPPSDKPQTEALSQYKPEVVEETKPATEEDINMISVPEILDQLLLTSTNIYEINTELDNRGQTTEKLFNENRIPQKEIISTTSERNNLGSSTTTKKVVPIATTTEGLVKITLGESPTTKRVSSVIPSEGLSGVILETSATTNKQISSVTSSEGLATNKEIPTTVKEIATTEREVATTNFEEIKKGPEELEATTFNNFGTSGVLNPEETTLVDEMATSGFKQASSYDDGEEADETTTEMERVTMIDKQQTTTEGKTTLPQLILLTTTKVNKEKTPAVNNEDTSTNSNQIIINSNQGNEGTTLFVNEEQTTSGNKEGTTSFTQEETPSIVNSIEQLIQQAVGNIAGTFSGEKESQKVSALMAAMNDKPMSEVQMETATAASSLLVGLISNGKNEELDMTTNREENLGTESNKIPMETTQDNNVGALNDEVPVTQEAEINQDGSEDKGEHFDTAASNKNNIGVSTNSPNDQNKDDKEDKLATAASGLVDRLSLQTTTEEQAELDILTEAMGSILSQVVSSEKQQELYRPTTLNYREEQTTEESLINFDESEMAGNDAERTTQKFSELFDPSELQGFQGETTKVIETQNKGNGDEEQNTKREEVVKEDSTKKGGDQEEWTTSRGDAQEEQSTKREEGLEEQSTKKEQALEEQSTKREETLEEQSTKREEALEEQSTNREEVLKEQSTKREEALEEESTKREEVLEEQSTLKGDAQEIQNTSSGDFQDEYVTKKVETEMDEQTTKKSEAQEEQTTGIDYKGEETTRIDNREETTRIANNGEEVTARIEAQEDEKIGGEQSTQKIEEENTRKEIEDEMSTRRVETQEQITVKGEIQEEQTTKRENDEEINTKIYETQEDWQSEVTTKVIPVHTKQPTFEDKQTEKNNEILNTEASSYVDENLSTIVDRGVTEASTMRLRETTVADEGEMKRKTTPPVVGFDEEGVSSTVRIFDDDERIATPGKIMDDEERITTVKITYDEESPTTEAQKKVPTLVAIITKPVKHETAALKPDLKKDDSLEANKWSLVSTISPNHYTQNPKITQKPVRLEEAQKPVKLDGFGSNGMEETTSHLDPDVKQFLGLMNELAFGFWNSVNNGMSAARSVFVSPFAATSLLAMVFLGARGATSGEMNEILRLDDMVTFNPHLILKNITESIEDSDSGVATSVILRELYSDKSKGKLLSFYKERAKQFYDGHVEEVGFKEVGDVVRRRTNLMVKRLTQGKVQEFIKDSSIKIKAPLAGVSVSIFQTDCSAASTEGRDGELYFVVLPSIRQRRLIPIPAAVWKSGFLAGYEPTLDATAVAIGNKSQIVSTIFVIPGQQGIAAPGDGLARLERHLMTKPTAWTALLKSLIPRPGLEVQIPRFSHRSVINASLALQRMGMKDLFDSQKADLRGLNGVANDLYLSDILQINSFATCGEDGVGDAHHSEIYPATADRTYRRSKKLQTYRDVELLEEPRDYQRAFHDPLHDPTLYSLPLPLRPRQARLPEPAPRLRFDRPFLYFVRHNPTGLILHMGRFNPRLLP